MSACVLWYRARHAAIRNAHGLARVIPCLVNIRLRRYQGKATGSYRLPAARAAFEGAVAAAGLT